MNASVDRLWFLGEPVAVQRRVVKAIGDQAGIQLEFKHVEEVLRFAADDGPSKELSLPLGWKVVRKPEQLVFETPDLREPRQQCNYEYELPMQGTVLAREIGVEFETQLISVDSALKHDADLLLDSSLLSFPLKLRNWRAGDRFWPAHTKSSRKIKELLQERHVPQAERKLWPVAVSGDEIVWVRGFPVPAKFRAKTGCEAVQILERPLGAMLSAR
jgi:tRNA(Ile)-lysidine synthase